jgi:MraZ protein
VFLGVNTLNVDAKGRMAIPAKHRDELASCCASRVVVTINPREHCLWLYPENVWRDIARNLSRLPTLKRQNLVLQRLLLGHASEVELDSQGRILLSTELREYASLDKRVALVGEGSRFEIWNEESWLGNRDGWLAEANDLDSDLSDELGDMVL